MQYHQIIIFFHRPWLSKSYIQPRSPRQGPGYHHARRMCVESATAIARLLQLFEKHYTFRRMNNQVVAIIFSAALMLLFVTVSSSPMSPGKQGDSPTYPRSTEMVAYLNLCFRALDELGQSFDNAKRTRDYLVTLQRRWQANMRRSGSATKRQNSSANLAALGSQKPSTQNIRATNAHDVDGSRKKSRLSVSGVPPNTQSTAPATTNQYSRLSQHTMPPHQQYHQQSSYQQQAPFPVPGPDSQLGDLDWIPNSDMRLLSETQNGNALNDMGQIPSPPFPEDPSMLSDIADIDAWWAPDNYTRTSMPP
jgi:hypothetical protein